MDQYAAMAYHTTHQMIQMALQLYVCIRNAMKYILTKSMMTAEPTL